MGEENVVFFLGGGCLGMGFVYLRSHTEHIYTHATLRVCVDRPHETNTTTHIAAHTHKKHTTMHQQLKNAPFSFHLTPGGEVDGVLLLPEGELDLRHGLELLERHRVQRAALCGWWLGWGLVVGARQYDLSSRVVHIHTDDQTKHSPT